MKNCSAALVLLVCWSGAGQAQSGEAAPVNLPAQKIGVDDLVAISVYGSPELTRGVRGSGEGQIRLPLVTRPIAAARPVPRRHGSGRPEAFRPERISVEPVV